MARTVSVKLLADVSGYVSGLKRGSDATKDFTGKLDQAARAGKLDAVADQATRFGLAGVAAFGLVVKAAADFDKQMSAVSAATRANQADMGRLRAAAIAAGKDTQFSATQAAQGITELSKAGVSTADILGGGLKGALSLAAAGQMEVGEAAVSAASAMGQFKLKGDQVPHVADLLAAAAGKAQGSVHDMGMALNQSGLVASQFGLSIEDTTGALAEFAHAGLLGSDAGTSLKTMLLAIANPSQQTKTLMDQLGISFHDANGQFVGMSGVAQVLQTRLKGLTQEQRNQALGQIFGNDAIRAASILYTDGAKGVEKWRGAVNDAGFASETAAKLTDNLAGDLERLKSSLETQAIDSGSGANSGLRLLTKSVGALVDGLGQLPPVVSSSMTVLAGVGGVVALGVAGWLKMRQGVASAVEQLNAVGPMGEKAAVGLQKGAAAAGKVAAAFAALQVAGAIVSAFQTELNPQIDAAAQGLEEWQRKCLLSGEAARIFGADSKDLDRALNGLANRGFSHVTDATTDWILGLGGVSSPLDDARIKADALDQALSSMVKSGHAAEAVGYLEQRAKATGRSVDELKKILPGYAAALETTGQATGEAAAETDKFGHGVNFIGPVAANTKPRVDALSTATKEYKTAADAAAGAAKGEAGALAALTTQLKAQADPVFALLDAEGNLTRAQKEATRAVREHGRSSDEAKESTRKLALAALDLQGKAGALGATFDGKMTPAMRTTLHAAGLTERQINDVAGQFRKAKSDGDKFAKNYQGNVSLTGAGPVAQKLSGLSQIQQALAKGVRIPINPTTFFHGLAEGGWTGPGSKYQPAGIVHADEFVVKADSRREFESARPGVLDHINRTGDLPPGYDSGGRVNVPYRTTAGMTRIPTRAEVEAAVIPPVPKGGRTSDWIVAAARALVPGIGVISKDRPGAHTLSGTLSYHALGRAVDFSPSITLARRWHDRYGSRTKEEISPWRQFDLHNGRAHHYSAALHAQHSGGNAHVHIAMGGGGVIREPIYGVGASGNTYSFGEGYRPETVTPGARGGGDIHVTVQAGYVVSEQDLENKIARTIDRLRLKGRA